MPILNLRNTAGEFEPIPAMIGPQGLQGVPGPNEITTATATPLSGVLVGKDGYVKEGEAGEDFAAAAHAAQHAANGADPIIPADIGAAAADDLTGHISTLVTGAAGAHGLKQYHGTWTPSFYGLTTAGSPVYGADRIGEFSIIGNLCLIKARVQLTSKGGMVGRLVLSGVPELPRPGLVHNGTFGYVNAESTAPTPVLPYIDAAGRIMFSGQSQADVFLNDTNIKDNFFITGLNILYFF